MSMKMKKILLVTLFLLGATGLSVHFLWAMGGSPKQVTELRGRYVDRLDGVHGGKLVLHYPSDATVVYKPSVLIKGVNKYLKAVFVNGKKIPIRKDGRFSYSLPLGYAGKHTAIVSYLTASDEVIHTTRRILRLHPAPSEGVNRALNERHMYFFNTDYVFPSAVPSLLKGYVTRAELAFFLARLKEADMSARSEAVFADVPASHWAAPAIWYNSYNRYMPAFPNNQFKPNEPVEKIEFIISLVKALELDINAKGSPLPYRDVNPRHWTYKFVRAAYDAKLLPKVTFLKMGQKLDQHTFARYAVRLDSVRGAIRESRDFNTGFDVSERRHNEVMVSIDNYFKALRQKEMDKRDIFFESPEQHGAVVGERATLKGRIYPSQEFRINGRRVVPSLEGAFAQTYPVRKGRNEFSIDAMNKRRRWVVWRLESYPDLSGHWFAAKAAQLKYAKLMGPEVAFEPKRVVTRAYFSQVVARMYKLKSEDSQALPFVDVSANSPDYLAIKAVYDNGILQGGRRGDFRPNAQMTRIEAIAAIVRMSKFTPLTAEELQEITIPFRDVSRYRWARDLIKTGYKHGVIKSSRYLNPGNVVTKAELLSLIYNTPRIQSELDLAFRRND